MWPGVVNLIGKGGLRGQERGKRKDKKNIVTKYIYLGGGEDLNGQDLENERKLNYEGLIILVIIEI